VSNPTRDRVLCITGCVAAILGPSLISQSARGIERHIVRPLSATLQRQETPVPAGEKVPMQVRIRNVSREVVVLAVEDTVPSSYFFTAQSGDEIEFSGQVEGHITDREDGDFYCPGDTPTFVVRPGQALVQVVQVPVPIGIRGAANVRVVLSLRLLNSSLRCGLSSVMDVTVSGRVNVSPPRADVPVKGRSQ
jgi:hypothetical protein